MSYDCANTAIQNWYEWIQVEYIISLKFHEKIHSQNEERLFSRNEVILFSLLVVDYFTSETSEIMTTSCENSISSFCEWSFSWNLSEMTTSCESVHQCIHSYQFWMAVVTQSYGIEFNRQFGTRLYGLYWLYAALKGRGISYEHGGTSLPWSLTDILHILLFLRPVQKSATRSVISWAGIVKWS